MSLAAGRYAHQNPAQWHLHVDTVSGHIEHAIDPLRPPLMGQLRDGAEVSCPRRPGQVRADGQEAVFSCSRRLWCAVLVSRNFLLPHTALALLLLTSA
jgi:hypothetical protein